MNTPPAHDFSALKAAAPVAHLPAVTRPRVFIGLCSRDWQTEIHTSESVRAISAMGNCEIVLPKYMLNDGVARARNNLAAMFLESNATHLLFLDNDIIIEPRQFNLMLEDVADGMKIVCGFYPKKQPVLDWVVNYIQGEKPDAKKRMRLKHAGTGCMLIAREVITDMIEKLKDKIEYRGDPGPTTVRWDLFPMHAEDGRYKSEDWFFCERAQQCGHTIWGDYRIQLRHVGKVVYPLQFTLSDDEVVDIIFHRYGMWPDQIRAFIASGSTAPGLFGGHRERAIRLWPKDYPVGDMHQSAVLAGMFDAPVDEEADKTIILDIGANVGAFVRYAAKRWPGCAIIAYEGSNDLFPWLTRTAADKQMTKESKVDAVNVDVTGANAAELPKASVLKIDMCGRERAILETLRPRFGEFDVVLIHYGNDMDAFFVSKLMEATHLLHCWQRMGENRGVQKFVGRHMKLSKVEVGG
jgi:hypothetical protein